MGIDRCPEDDTNNQISASISDEVARIQSRIPQGKSATHCVECGAKIPKKRREAMPGVQYCIECQEEIDRSYQAHSLYNRRASLDSQLR